MAQHAAARRSGSERVVAGGPMQPSDGVLPPRVTVTPKPLDHQIVRDHLNENPPAGKKLESLGTAA